MEPGTTQTPPRRFWRGRHTIATLVLGVVSPGLVILSMSSCEGAPTRVDAADEVVIADSAAMGVRAESAPRAVLPEIRSEPVVRVRIGKRLDTATIECDGRATLVPPDPRSPVRRASSPMSVRTSIGLNGSGPGEVVLRDASGVATRLAPGELVELRAGLGSALTIDGVAQPNRLIISVRRDGKGFDLIAVPDIEDYVASVITGELYAGWSLATYKVQAVCARSYALHERWRGLSSGRPYDVESTTADQVFVGSSVRERARRAALATRGIVLENDGNLLRTYYSSTCGGRSASAADTWPVSPGWEFNASAPIQASERDHACQVSPLYRWKAERPPSDFVRRLAAFGRDRGRSLARIRAIQSIEVERANDLDRPARYRVTDAQGKAYSLTAEELRLACNTKAAGLPELERPNLVRSGDMVFTIEPDRILIEGRGFGHGVGMCQFCAHAMGERGDDWRSILTRFYPGARIVRAY